MGVVGKESWKHTHFPQKIITGMEKGLVWHWCHIERGTGFFDFVENTRVEFPEF
jgi:hypothetical protein